MTFASIFDVSFSQGIAAT